MPDNLFSEIRDYLDIQHSLGKKRVLYSPKVSIPSQQTLSTKEESWDSFREKVLECTQCSLCKERTQVVFGEGNESATLVFVGEGPGFDEDTQGRPFVGKAGQLLTKMIEAMNLKREDVYIANIVKCRPPQNRTPQPDEIQSCFPYLVKQLEKIKPKIICALGNVAAQTLLQTSQTISRLRGMFHEINGIQIMPTFHPAYLLRNPEFKREVWRDLQMIMEKLK